MIIITILIVTVAVLYAILMIFLAWGWKRLKSFRAIEHNNAQTTVFASIIIAARNEGKNIALCLEDILQQNFPQHLFEVVVVNDHSEDDTVDIVNAFISRFENLMLVDLANGNAEGKKAAIAKGIEKAHGELIITTDADCRVDKNWLLSIVNYYHEFRPVMISGPVVFTAEQGFMGNFMKLEFISLVASGAGGIGLGKPLMCNGANLAFRRDAYLMDEIRTAGSGLASGDDIFLMHGIAAKFGEMKVHFLKCTDAIVKTPSPANLRSFLAQRVRWGSKTRAYLNTSTAYVAMIVFLNSISLFISTVLFYFQPQLLIPLLFAWSLKTISDFAILYPATKFFNERKLLWWIPIFEPLHVIYITFSSLLSLLPRFTWKGRVYQLKM